VAVFAIVCSRVFYSSSSQVQPLLPELLAVIRRAPLIWHMAMSETRARYKRSVLGPFWLTLGAGIGVAGLGVVWSSLLHTPVREFVPSLAVGLLLWQLIASTIVEACTIFIRQAQIIRNVRLPLLVHPAQLVTRQLITFAHNMVVLVIVFALFPQQSLHLLPLSLLGFVLLVINLLWMTTVLAMLGARFRDIEQIVTAVMPLIFFLTPVLYRTSHFGATQAVVWLNPFTYLISVVRDPLLGTVPTPAVYVGTVCITVAGTILALALFASRRNRIPYWI
jgi:ABC-type polysaccharide/polyol phosphate export permease